MQKSSKQKDYSQKDYIIHKGASLETLAALTLKEQAKYARANIRRSLLREAEGNHLARVRARIDKKLEQGVAVKTACRQLVILPGYVGHVFNVHQGKEYVEIKITRNHVLKRLGEFALGNRVPVKHGQLGKGATQASKKVSLT